MTGRASEPQRRRFTEKIDAALSEGGPLLVVRRAFRRVAELAWGSPTAGMAPERFRIAAKARIGNLLAGNRWRRVAFRAMAMLDDGHYRDAVALLTDSRSGRSANRSLRFLLDVAQFSEANRGQPVERLRSGVSDSENLISVVVPFYNHLPYLDGLFRGLAEQTYARFEVVIVDDQSDPAHDPRETIEAWRSDLDIRFERLSHKGYTSGARQRGVELARGQILSFIDADDVPQVQRMECVNHLFASHDIVHLTHGYETFSEEWEGRTRKVFEDVHEADAALTGSEALRLMMEENVLEARWSDGPWNQGNYGVAQGHATQAGHLSYLRSLAVDTPWRGGNAALFSVWEDYDMNMQLLFKYRASAHVDLPLSGYRVGSSTHGWTTKGLY